MSDASRVQQLLEEIHDLHRQLDQAQRDLNLATRLDAIRLTRATRGELDYYRRQADGEYAGPFARC